MTGSTAAGSVEPPRPGTGSVHDSPASSGSRRLLPLDFEEVYAEHFAFIWRSIRGLGVPPAAADDIAQDVFVIVHRKLDSLQSPQALKSWLFGIARRVCKDYRRSNMRRGPHLELDAQREVDGSSDPQQRAVSRQALGAVERFAESLDDERRAIFFLALIEGLPVSEVAETLGVNPNTTYSRVRVLRQELTQLLEGAPSVGRGNDGRS